MEAAEASLWFSDTPLAGWNGTAWVSEIAWGDFLTYDRFITDRTFGAKKRLYLTHESYSFDPVTYPVVKTPDSKVWIVVSKEVDMNAESPYAETYLLLETAFTASIQTIQTTTLASGQVRKTSVTSGSSIPCDMEQFGIDISDAAKQAVYGTYIVTLPGGTVLSESHELLIDGLYYVVQEVTKQLLTVIARTERRGG
jgi:hypothetical protein